VRADHHVVLSPLLLLLCSSMLCSHHVSRRTHHPAPARQAPRLPGRALWRPLGATERGGAGFGYVAAAAAAAAPRRSSSRARRQLRTQRVKTRRDSVTCMSSTLHIAPLPTHTHEHSTPSLPPASLSAQQNICFPSRPCCCSSRGPLAVKPLVQLLNHSLCNPPNQPRRAAQCRTAQRRSARASSRVPVRMAPCSE
jgi:hypothetical protein